LQAAERTRVYLADRIEARLQITGGEDAHLHDAEGNDYIDWRSWRNAYDGVARS
jgi:4-aminobutyrate aminotransferase-like enzyme